MQKYFKFIYPILVFIALIFIYSIIETLITDILVYTYQIWFDFFINSNGQELLRQVEIQSKESGVITFLTAFIDLSNISKSPVKNIDIELFNEIALPLIFFVAAVFSFVNRTNYKQVLLFFIILFILLWFKNIIIIYDNYTHPDYILKDLIFPFKQIVYYTNSILQKVGTSFSMMVSVVIVVVFVTFNTNLIKNITQNS